MKSCKNNIYYLYTISNEHLSEMVTEYENIVKYKTNFTGDTAMYIENDTKKYLLVDGRFSIQARNEVDTKNIQVIDISREYNLYDFLGELSKNNKIILYIDEKTESIYRVEKIKESFSNIDLKCIDLYKKSGFDEYRKNIFHMASSPLFLLDDNIRLFDKKIKKEILDGGDVYITSSKIENAYLTNLRYEFSDVNDIGVLFDSYLIIENNKSYLYIHDYIDENIEKYFCKNKVIIKKYEDFYNDLKKYKNKIILLDKSINNYKIYKNLNKKYVKFIDSKLETMMSIKTDDEIKNLIKTNIIDGVAITNAIYEITNNLQNIVDKKVKKITEYDIRKFVDNERRKNKSFLCPSFSTIVAFKENSAICHYLPTKEKSKVVTKDGILLIDSGGHYTTGTTDITRTFSLYKNKNKIDKNIKKHFTLVLKSMLNLQNQIFPEGYSGRELDLIARKDLYNELLDFEHGTGHGIGYVTSVHDGPNLISPGVNNDNDKNVLMINQVQSDEPGLYFANKYGIRIENDIYVNLYKIKNETKFLHFSPLTICPIDKNLIDKKLLTENEIKYLNDYHKFVYDKLHKYFKNEKLVWLKKSCEKI